jgi:hypothetical protein
MKWLNFLLWRCFGEVLLVLLFSPFIFLFTGVVGLFREWREQLYLIVHDFLVLRGLTCERCGTYVRKDDECSICAVRKM